jgi:hypothetical protein
VRLAKWCIYSVLIALDQLVKVLFVGYPDEIASFKVRDGAGAWEALGMRALRAPRRDPHE